MAQNVPELNWTDIVAAFHKKVKFKNIEFTGIDQMINPENDKQLMAAWNNSLSHQINPGNLLPYETVRDELYKLLVQIFQ